MQRIAEKLTTALGVAVANRTSGSAVNGTGVAVAEGSEVIGICVFGAIAATADCLFALEESDVSNSGYAPISGAETTVAGVQTSGIVLLSARPTKRYVRATVDPGGAGVGDGVLSGMHLLIVPRTEPAVSNPANVIA